ncbi:hypothetical protein CDD82_3668 [Ophiocordyceps australis]|uniref:Zn(2)-C6 fungal-type domain-containing protein n=1 Tax=Ophiocordyceps australis TaxID=1399860 RepID=A0A2C5ZD26_9HYPO|nr:hypothetical protein CDD82_3668 [Ophiocordyceps australis]
MSNDPLVRAPMGSYPFVSQQQFPQRETQKNYVFVDEHNRHKRLKVMRACEGCRRRKIKCDAATTNTWPCSACIRLKLHCVRPNGFDGASDSPAYEPNRYPHMSLQSQPPSLASSIKPAAASALYSSPAFHQVDASAFQALALDASHSHQDLNYTTLSPSAVPLVDQTYAPQSAFPTPPLQQLSQPASSPDDSYDPYQQQDLADLLGTLKVNEVGTAPYLRNKASFRQQEQPALEDDDDFGGVLPPMVTGPGHKIRIPPELMPDDETALTYFQLYFTHVHPYVPVLDKSQFYQQWDTARDSLSPLILEALFAIGGRLAEEPAQGQQWLALASRHADSFMDTPRLSTLQALLLILKAREAAPKRGYYYRSWMTVVQCVQMSKDLGLDEHYDDHQSGHGCDLSLSECQLRRRIWQTVFVCEVMVGTPQGRHDLSVDIESVDFNIPSQLPGSDDSEYFVSRNFTYFARLVRNIAMMSSVYAKIKRRKDWAIDPEFQQLSQNIEAYMAELPTDLTITFPSDNSPPWLPSCFVGNLHSYYYLTIILFHRPALSFLDPTTNEPQWKCHMMMCYNAARALCRVQEAIINTHGLIGLQTMQRGFSFTVYAGLSCIVLHLVAIVSPDAEFNADAPAYFTRHMRLMERVMEAWTMPELQKQINAVREAFSADVRRPFVLKPTFPYGSPHSSHPSPPRPMHRFRPALEQQQHLPGGHQQAQAPLVMMPDGQAREMQHDMAIPISQPTWNPARIFEQWNTSFGAPSQSDSLSASQAASLDLSSAGTPDMASMQVVQGSMGSNAQSIPGQQYPTPTHISNFITPAMWQESVASVYEGGLKRSWDYDALQTLKN